MTNSMTNSTTLRARAPSLRSRARRAVAGGPGLLLLGALAAGCATSSIPDSSLEGIALLGLNPGAVVRDSSLVIEGSSFVGEPFATSKLRLRGVFRPDISSEFDVDVVMPARFVDFDRMEATAGDELFAAIEDLDGVFIGEAIVEVLSAEDGNSYNTSPLPIELAVTKQLTPRLAILQDEGVIFVNDRITVNGGGLLLGGGEGTTVAVVDGCFEREGAGVCQPTGAIEVPVTPASAFDRSQGFFEFSPTIAGINPGQFRGSVRLRNRHGDGAALESGVSQATYDMIRPAIFQISTTTASLGQFVVIEGGGFVGRQSGARTAIRLVGSFTPESGPARDVPGIDLIPEFSSGNLVRYVLSEEDTLGQALDLRREPGVFSGQVTPVISYLGEQIAGTSETMSFAVVPVKQVVYLDFTISYVESLRKFGLRAVDSFIRERVADNIRRDFAGVNIAIRLDPPEDFALYTHIEIVGPDPEGTGLFSYDARPGKDDGNKRIDDRIGGDSASEQSDGTAGYGGMFIESLFGFSTSSNDFAAALPGASSTFDAIFDPFRPDRDGSPVVAVDLANADLKLVNSDICPASTRPEQIACGVWVLGALISSSLSHQLGHALGLADPDGAGLHNLGDRPNRLMDAGIDRPFAEQAEIEGLGPALFCDQEYIYLRQILPSTLPADPTPRPSCL